MCSNRVYSLPTNVKMSETPRGSREAFFSVSQIVALSSSTISANRDSLLLEIARFPLDVKSSCRSKFMDLAIRLTDFRASPRELCVVVSKP